MERATPAGSTGTTSRVIWQATPEYRLVQANNAFGFGIQALNAGNTWTNVEAMPAYALLPMLRQFGILQGIGIGLNGGPANGGSTVKRVRSGTSQTKTSTSRTV